MNQVAIPKEPKSELLPYMAGKYALLPDEFARTVRATCGLSTATPEQFAAFLIVAKQYNLNPITKEIYAFAGRGGGIVPIVSIDGWVNLVNSHGQCDGFEFDMEHDEAGGLIACTCRMFRKDRKHPVTVTEYLSECARATDPWKMQHRMLRHKALIQAARYAFGFAGVYDEDEARTIAESEPRDVTPRGRVPSPSDAEQIEDHGSDKYRPGDTVQVDGEVLPPEKEDPISSGPQAVKPKAPPKKKKGDAPDLNDDYDSWFSWAMDKVRNAPDGGQLEAFWESEVAPNEKALFPPDWNDITDAYGKRHEQFKADREQ